VTAEAVARKERSVAFLKVHHVPIHASLPLVEDSASARLRSVREISERLVACTIAAVAGETGDNAFVEEVIAGFAARSLLSPREQEFIEHRMGDQQERVQFSWRYERSWALLWALGYVERLDYPPSVCDVPKLAELIRGKSLTEIGAKAKPRSVEEILDEADLIYRLHWAVVDDRLNHTANVPEGVDKGVVQERHAALNWLIGYQGQEWDEITTDT